MVLEFSIIYIIISIMVESPPMRRAIALAGSKSGAAGPLASWRGNQARRVEMRGESVWTDERIAGLKRLWADGLSASQIAAELAGMTRNAVLGKAHRLGLCGRAKQTSIPPRRCGPPRARTSRPPVAAIRQKPVADAAAPIIAAPVGQRCTILTLTADACRWPCGDPDQPDFFFCGGQTAGGLPYCADHARVAYQPAADTRPTRCRPSRGAEAAHVDVGVRGRANQVG
jgi:GcrA cell cycle regulator